MSSNDKSLIAGMMGDFVSEVPAKPFVSFCVFCNKGVIQEEMVYEKGKVFHKDCYTNHGSSFPTVNQELLSKSTNAKVQLIQLKNLQIRMKDKKRSSRKTKTKRKTKHTTKRKPKRKTTRRKKTARRKKTKKKSKRRVTKRRTSTRKKTRRKTKRRVTRRTKRKTRRR